MTEKEIIQQVEEILENYPSNLTRIEVLRKDLTVLRASTDVTSLDYIKVINDDTKKDYSDPVVRYVLKIEKLEEEIKRLERITDPITKMVQDLKSPYATDSSLNNDFVKLLGLYYFGRNPVQIVLDETKWSRAGFFRKRKRLALLAKNYLGF